MVAIAFYSITGQTERFIKKTQLSAHQIDDANPKYDMGKSYILIVSSYQDFMMDSVVDFLTYKDNKKNIIGIIGCGNRNFNDLFAQTAKKIVHDLSAGESTKQVQKPKELRGNISFLSDFRD